MPENPKRKELACLFESVSDMATYKTYDAGHPRKITRRELKEISETNKQNGGLEAARTNASIPDSEMKRILPKFRNLLDEFVDSDTERVGNGLVRLAGGPPDSTLSEYVQILIRASAVLGGERTAELLIGWIQGEPVRYREMSILRGITVDQTLKLQEGLILSQLPQSRNELVSHFPAMISKIPSPLFVKGCVELSIECEASPALFQPPKGEGELTTLNRIRAQGQIEKLSVDSFCEAMSLACDSCVWRQLSWDDFGELQEFLSVYGGISWTDVPQFTSATNFKQEHFECARKIQNIRSAEKYRNPSLDIAIRRWIKSKASESEFADELIDLRIALESLYLKDTDGELRFRLASYGAWHIGLRASERKKIFQTLNEIYKLASKAVHRGDVEKSDINEKLLRNAQELCRKGILKRLEQEAEPEWKDLIMGDKL